MPFTDKRVGSLLADVIKCILGKNELSFKQGSDYKWEINFTVEDEYIVIGKNQLTKVFKNV